ncbi:unnamed protein product, partial [Symbiodinium sp. CCMP2456]
FTCRLPEETQSVAVAPEPRSGGCKPRVQKPDLAEGVSRKRTLDDADAAHWAACNVKGCARCVFIRNREEWQAKLPMGDMGVSWLHGYLDGDDGLFKLKCRACEKTKQTNRFAGGVVTTLFGNLSRHHSCSQHQSALAALGLGPETEEVPAPAAADFHLVAENRLKGTALRHGIKGLGGQHKTTCMEIALGQAMFEIDRAFLADATSVAIFADARQHMLLLRFRACNDQLITRRGLLGYRSLGTSSGASGLHDCIQGILEDFCTGLDGVLQTELLTHLRASVEMYVADAASDEQLTGQLLRSQRYFENLRFVSKDRAHASQRLLSRPWHASGTLRDILDKFAIGSESIAHKVQYSPHISQVFQAFCKESSKCPLNATRVRNLGHAKHRFSSLSKPLGRAVLHVDSLVKTAIWLTVHRSQKVEGREAADFLQNMQEREYLLAALLADASDESVRLLRVFDTESYDLSVVATEIQVFMSRLHFLFNEERP